LLTERPLWWRLCENATAYFEKRRILLSASAALIEVKYSAGENPSWRAARERPRKLILCDRYNWAFSHSLGSTAVRRSTYPNGSYGLTCTPQRTDRLRPTSIIRSQAARGASGAYRERLIAKAIITPEAYGRISLDDLLSDRRRVMIERAYEPARNDDEAL